MGVQTRSHQAKKRKMTDETQNLGVQTEVANPEVSQQDNAKEQAESRQSGHFANLRRQNEELKRTLKMQEEMMGKLMTMQQTQQAPQQEVDELSKLGDTDYVQGSDVKKLAQKAEEKARKAAREETEKVLREREQGQYLDKLKRKFSDFDEVVNPETLALLEEQDPDLAQEIVDVRDPYKIGYQSYKYIKALGLAEKVPTKRRVKEVEKRIEENSKTVQTPQVFDKRPMAQAFKMTDAEKSKLADEMYHYASLAGGSL
jgi:hypothetical protein